MRPGPDARFEAQNLVSTNVPGVVKSLRASWHGNGIVIVQVATSRMRECSDELCKSRTRGLGEAGYL